MSPKMGTLAGTVYGEAAVEEFAKQHAASRKPLARFLAIARAATWKHFPEVTQTFPATDYAHATGTLIFDIGGLKNRPIPRLVFEGNNHFFHTLLAHKHINLERPQNSHLAAEKTPFPHEPPTHPD